MYKSLLVAMVAVVVGFAVQASAEDGNPAKVVLENRGLIQIDGIVKGNSEGGWGASNLILKPFGGWAAQDYCLKNTKKEGNTITADFSTKPKVNMVEKLEAVKNDDGTSTDRLTYTFTEVDGKPISFERVFMTLPVASKDFAGGKAILDGGVEVDIPVEYDDDMVAFPKETKSLKLVKGNKSLTLKSDKLTISMKDMRAKSTTMMIEMEYPEPVKLKELTFTLDIAATK